MARRLLWHNVVPPDTRAHVARLHLGRGEGFGVHTHDFAEVFWIERGAGMHLINGQRDPLSVGDLVLIRPRDRHDFVVRQAEGLTFVNVAFEASALRAIHTRYFSARRWPWTGGVLPAKFQLTPADLTQLRTWADDLARAAPTALQRDWFLLSLLQLIGRSPLHDQGPDRPGWLDEAIAHFNTPERFAGGVACLARLSGRCPEHLNRVVRRTLGKTATDLVNDLRLDFAARELRMTNRPILDIALDCGLENLGYFYRIFKRRFALTPRQFRLRREAVVK
jgi:AraC-like DNA-binding protein/mannose-6-phosphate isomerase-like protein (cupin superfamily)